MSDARVQPRRSGSPEERHRLGVAPAARLFTNTPALPQPEILVYRAKEKFDEEGRLTDEKTREFTGKLLRELADWTRRLNPQRD